MKNYKFRKSHFLKVYNPSDKYIGIFNYEIELDDVTIKITQEIIDWCSNTCHDNFIIIQTKNRVVAGGCADNYKEWEQNQFNASARWKNEDCSYTAFIRLTEIDYFAFMLRYADEITYVSQ